MQLLHRENRRQFLQCVGLLLSFVVAVEGEPGVEAPFLPWQQTSSDPATGSAGAAVAFDEGTLSLDQERADTKAVAPPWEVVEQARADMGLPVTNKVVAPWDVLANQLKEKANAQRDNARAARKHVMSMGQLAAEDKSQEHDYYFPEEQFIKKGSDLPDAAHPHAAIEGISLIDAGRHTRLRVKRPVAVSPVQVQAQEDASRNRYQSLVDSYQHTQQENQQRQLLADLGHLESQFEAEKQREKSLQDGLSAQAARLRASEMDKEEALMARKQAEATTSSLLRTLACAGVFIAAALTLRSGGRFGCNKRALDVSPPRSTVGSATRSEAQHTPLQAVVSATHLETRQTPLQTPIRRFPEYDVEEAAAGQVTLETIDRHIDAVAERIKNIETIQSTPQERSNNNDQQHGQAQVRTLASSEVDMLLWNRSQPSAQSPSTAAADLPKGLSPQCEFFSLCGQEGDVDDRSDTRSDTGSAAGCSPEDSWWLNRSPN